MIYVEFTLSRERERERGGTLATQERIKITVSQGI